MHIFELQRVTSLLLTGLLCGTALLARAPGADTKDEAAAKPTPTVKTEAPAPITARERKHSPPVLRTAFDATIVAVAHPV